MKKTTLIFIPLLLLFVVQLKAQEPEETSEIWQVETKDDNKYIGKILSMEGGEVRIQTEKLGVITIQKEDVKRMERIDPDRVIGGEFWGDNVQATRYFWAPNGYGIRKGEGYYQNVWVFFNQVSTGVTENFSIGVGMVPIFLFGGSATPIWITPKLSFPIVKDKFNVGAGALIGTILGDESGFFGIAYGVTTFGSRDKNVNIGIGYGFANDEWANAPTISLSTMQRIGKRGYFISENYLLPFGDDPLFLLSLGGRTVWDKISLDYGLVIPAGGGIGEFVAGPWLGLTLPLRKKAG